MFPVSTKAGGMTMAMPDVCKTPVGNAVVPIPYPNMGSLSQSSGVSTKVKIAGAAAFTMKSKITMSSGDEPGTMKGVMSSKNKGECKPKKGSSKVKIQGQPAIFMTCMFGHNGSNANHPAGIQSVPSQAKVLVLG